MQVTPSTLTAHTKNNARRVGRLQPSTLVLAGLLTCAGMVQTAVAGQETTAPIAQDAETARKSADQVSERAEEPKPQAKKAKSKIKAKKGEGERDAKAKQITVEEYKDYAIKVEKAVAEGKLTAEQGQAKLIAARKMIAAKGGDADPMAKIQVRISGLLGRMDADGDGVITTAEAGDFWPRIAPVDANKDGKVTKKEMIVAWSPKKSKVAADEKVMQRINGVLARMDQNKDGVVTSTEAGQWWSRVAPADANMDGNLTRKEMLEAWSPKQKDKEAEAKKIWAELEALVAAGKITEVQAKERFAAFEKAQAKKGAVGDQSSPQAGIERIQAAIKRVQTAVEAGKLTPAQGKEKIEALKKELAEQKKSTPELEKVIARVEAGVQSGRITVEQGQQRIEAYKKKLKAKGKKESGETPKRP